MADRLVLHLGIHKTATTSLQRFLEKNSDQLLELKTVFTPLRKMRGRFTPKINKSSPEELEDVNAFIKGVESGNVLWSDENILGWSGDIQTGVVYPHAGRRLSKLCDAIECREIVIVITLRSPEKFITSMYSEYLRHRPVISFDEFADPDLLETFSYAHIFDWVEALPENVRVVFVPFEKEYGGGIPSILDRILHEACGKDASALSTGFPSRRSRSAFSLEELELAKEVSRQADGKTAQFFLVMLENRNCRFGDTRFSPIAPDLAHRLEDTYVNDLRSLQAQTS